MRRQGRHLLLAIVATGWLAVPTSAQTMFPTAGLEARIDFWKQVFTQYGADDIVVHDRFYVNLIYAVADDDNAEQTVRDVKESLREIRDRLSAPGELSDARLKIRQAIVDAGLEPSAPLLDELLDRIHTQRGVKERFRAGIIRSGRYLESFQKIMEDRGVPAPLALLPLVESSYENARSSAAAVGVWQFTRATSRDYLLVSRGVDERLDPVKSAHAAAKLLTDNYDALGTWPLAITAYNHGRGGMLRAKDAHGSDLPTIINEYRAPLFGYASMNFYTEFLAAAEVYERRGEYFGPLELERPLGAPPVKAMMAKASAARPATTNAAGANRPASRTISYTVRRGDTLTDIAQRFGTSIRQLMAKNKLTGHSIYAGQILVVK
jgi:membrane-bound lytic murein transglycosylase D